MTRLPGLSGVLSRGLGFGPRFQRVGRRRFSGGSGNWGGFGRFWLGDGGFCRGWGDLGRLRLHRLGGLRRLGSLGRLGGLRRF